LGISIPKIYETKVLSINKHNRAVDADISSENIEMRTNAEAQVVAGLPEGHLALPF
jgi:hypothetical protein